MLRMRGVVWAAQKPIVNGVGTDIRVGPDHQARDRKESAMTWEVIAAGAFGTDLNGYC